MVVAVTGATGHIGASLVRALLDEGRAVRAVLHGDCSALDGLELDTIAADVCDPASLRQAFEGAEVVYHLAAHISITGPQGGLVRRVNVDGARNAAEAALACGVKRFIHFSSIHAFDLDDMSRVLDETGPRAKPHHPAYDCSKNDGERAVRDAVERGLDAVIVHPVGCMGPLDYRVSRVGQVFLDLFARKLPALVDGGFHWVDTRDVVAGAMAAELKGRTGESYILSCEWRSVRQLAELAEEVTGVPAPRLVTPMWLAGLGAPFMTLGNTLFGIEPLYTSEGLHALRANRRLSTKKAEDELGFSPRPLRDTVADIYEWFDQTGKISLASAAKPTSPS